MLLYSMYADTHCHMSMIKDRKVDMSLLFNELVDTKVPFVLDIGTKYNDLPIHIDFISKLIESSLTEDKRKIAHDMFHFSAGLWPGLEEILNRQEYVKSIEEYILKYKNTHNVCALGECGLDRNWNKADENGLIHGHKADVIINGEEELFEMQIDLARKLDLPVIVHSRDAAQETYNCIKNMGWHNGVIHCYSYGLEEAKLFLDLGWYISLSGTITYAKKDDIENVKNLVKYIPKDLLLLETDAPYLTPVPMRGRPNTPIMVKHVYKYVSDILKISETQLCGIVLENAKKLFTIM